MHNFSTKQNPKPVIDDGQLQVLVTALTEAKEEAIVGGGNKLFVGNLNAVASTEFIGPIRTTFTF